MQQLTVLGAGVLGTQIAFQAAYHGKNVVIYDVQEQVLAGLGDRWEYLKPLYLRDVSEATTTGLEAAVGRIQATTDLATAVQESDLIIEAVPEVLEIKRDVWKQVGQKAPEKSIFATNSSTLLPSDMADVSGRPEKFLALHFSNEIWRQNIGEVMGHVATEARYLDAVSNFAAEIGMVPVRLKKEQPGYIVNSLLVPFMTAAAKLYIRDVAEVQEIDATWRRSTGAPLGPFEIYDLIGMETPYNVNVHSEDAELRKFAAILKRDFIDQGRLGRAVGQGFYDYD